MDKTSEKVFRAFVKTESTFGSGDEKIYNSEEKSAENELLQTEDEMEDAMQQLKIGIQKESHSLKLEKIQKKEDSSKLVEWERL